MGSRKPHDGTEHQREHQHEQSRVEQCPQETQNRAFVTNAQLFQGEGPDQLTITICVSKKRAHLR